MPQVQTSYLSRVLLVLFLVGAAKQGSCSNFSYTSFPKKDEGMFEKFGGAYIVKDAFQVTLDIRDSISDASGRILYKKLIKLWKQKEEVASFNSTFVLRITSESNPPGDGLAFILTKSKDVTENSMGQWLGIVNANTNGSSSHNNIVAVEFDTKKSFSDDLDNNHVGVNINSINSMKSASLNSSGIIIANGTFLTAMILYNGQTKTMNISVFQGNLTRAEPPVLSVHGLDLSRYLPQNVYVGFSASTGSESVQRNCILQWYFTIDKLSEDPKLPRWAWFVISVGVVVSLCGVCGFGYLCYKRKNTPPDSNESNDLPIFSGVGPKKFKLKDLSAATSNFNQKYELGQGGFGIVYKGILEGQSVAVKRVKDTPKGKQNLITEVTTIGSLHHKNLVELIGWCYEGSELLLVYEYMHNRSLDKLLYCNDGNLGKETSETKLSWNKRYNIICGVAHALDYLHNECLKRVLHRDIKASNIMLDSEFNARLGDFGLARMFKLSEKTHHSTNEIAGTPGYMAPEIFHTGKATTETDVFAFGVLALVVVSGRKAGVQDGQNECSNSIIDWAWELQKRS